MRRPSMFPTAVGAATLGSEDGINGGGDGTWGPLHRRESNETDRRTGPDQKAEEQNRHQNKSKLDSY